MSVWEYPSILPMGRVNSLDTIDSKRIGIHMAFQCVACDRDIGSLRHYGSLVPERVDGLQVIAMECGHAAGRQLLRAAEVEGDVLCSIRSVDDLDDISLAPGIPDGRSV